MEIGDKVLILNREYPEDKYRLYFTKPMTLYSGQIATIKRKIVSEAEVGAKYYLPDDGYHYKLDIDNMVHNWTTAMIESASNVYTINKGTFTYKNIRE